MGPDRDSRRAFRGKGGRKRTGVGGAPGGAIKTKEETTGVRDSSNGGKGANSGERGVGPEFV